MCKDYPLTPWPIRPPLFEPSGFSTPALVACQFLKLSEKNTPALISSTSQIRGTPLWQSVSRIHWKPGLSYCPFSDWRWRRSYRYRLQHRHGNSGCKVTRHTDCPDYRVGTRHKTRSRTHKNQSHWCSGHWKNDRKSNSSKTMRGIWSWRKYLITTLSGFGRMGRARWTLLRWNLWVPQKTYLPIACPTCRHPRPWLYTLCVFKIRYSENRRPRRPYHRVIGSGCSPNDALS